MTERTGVSWVLATTDPVGFAEALVGLPVATVVVAVVVVLGLAIHRRYLVLGRELATAELVREKEVEALNAAHEREIVSLHEHLEVVAEERDWWRDMAVQALDLGERAVRTRRRE